MNELLGIGNLAELQVSSLISRLHEKTIMWKNEFYHSAYINAPKISGTEVTANGNLEITAETEGARAPAQHISNSSDLRATLIAFLISFWQYLIEVRGGLSLILFDDLQELFDKENRRLVAKALTKIVIQHGRIIVTTNDTTFSNKVCESFNYQGQKANIGHLRIHPLNSSRMHIVLGKFKNVIEEKQEAFDNNQNDDRHAQEYLNELRIYVENQLIDFFDISDSGLPSNPTLSDLSDLMLFYRQLILFVH